MIYYGHTRENPATKELLPKEKWQLLKEHLEEVARLAEERAAKFGAGKLGRIIGLAHDLGKYSEEFQKRLEGAPGKVDHTTAGTQEVYRRVAQGIGHMLAFPIAGHHGGLPDGNKGDPKNLPGRLAKTGIPDYQAYAQEIAIPGLDMKELAEAPRARNAAMATFSLAFYIRMLFSCLVDADYLDTERTMNAQKFMARSEPEPLAALLQRLEEKLALLAERSRQNPSAVNAARQAIQAKCLAMAEARQGLFTLTVPTGGGKTYSSLAFGLKHAVRNKQDRVIYVIPYTSIIEQNAQVFRDALGDAAVLEHHSNFEYPEGDFNDWDPEEKAHRLAAENWDKPVVVTTAVQFFESLFANKGSRCRKLHNMANSVIILDEAQMLPIDYLRPCLWALAELVLNYGATIVLCTATQPAVKSLFPSGLPVTEIMEDPDGLQQIFKRVTVHYAGDLTDEEVATAMAKERQALTIVNTRRHARLLFDRLAAQTEEGIFHLSARMCPAHRKGTLAEIHRVLQAGQACRVVSTQLVEAGVDIDFPVVYRTAAGLDSVAQAAGRCNREARRAAGRVVLFDPEPHGMPSRGRFAAVAALTRSTLRLLPELGGELLSLKAIEHYFQQLLDLEKDSLDARGILKMIRAGEDGLAFPFARLAREFQLIDKETVPVVVPWDRRAEELMDEAARHPFPAGMARKLQPYVVQIYRYELAALAKEGAVRPAGDLINFVTDTSFYSPRFGLKEAKEVKAPEGILMF